MVNFRVQTSLWRCKFACKRFYFLSLWCLSLHSTFSTPHIDFGRMQSLASKFHCQKVKSEKNNIGYQGEHISDSRGHLLWCQQLPVGIGNMKPWGTLNTTIQTLQVSSQDIACSHFL